MNFTHIEFLNTLIYSNFCCFPRPSCPVITKQRITDHISYANNRKKMYIDTTDKINRYFNPKSNKTFKAKLGMPIKVLKHFSLKIRLFFQCKFYILVTNNSNLYYSNSILTKKH